LSVPPIFNTIEQSSLSTWIRESDSLFGFYFILLLHTIGLSMLVGANTIVDLRILGVAYDVPLRSLKSLFTLMWMGFVLNATTGIFLLIGYPTKALTNPMFYIKLIVIASGLITAKRIKNRVFDDASLTEEKMVAKGKTMAKWSLVLWIGAITAGRLLAYTYTHISYGRNG
jgi:hypothetical protein